MKRKKKGGEEGASWQDTYGDMVTLLLCFFVLLYSMSTIDTLKWELIVRSFNPEADKVSQIVIDEEQQEEGTYFEGKADVPLEDFEDLYYALSQAVKESGLESEVEISKGDGYTFINFRDSVFFDGDSSVLKEEGKRTLDAFISVLDSAAANIGEIQVLGHTAQARPDQENNPENDRMLSSARAARVTAYIHMNSSISPDKLVATGYGQYRPIASNDTSEERAKNRRVELLITKDDAVVQSLEQYYDQIYDITN